MFKRNIIDAQRVHRTGRRRRFSISPFDQGNARAGMVSKNRPPAITPEGDSLYDARVHVECVRVGGNRGRHVVHAHRGQPVIGSVGCSSSQSATSSTPVLPMFSRCVMTPRNAPSLFSALIK